jgi:hypothetical protein
MGGVVLAALLSACTHHPTDAEKRTMSALTNDMHIHGLGRYAIDLPPAWRFGSGNVTLYYGLGTDFKTVEVTVIDQGVMPSQFQAAVAWRAQRIQATTNHKTHGSMLVGSWPVDVRVDDGNGGRDRQGVLLRYYDDTTLDNYHDHEIHLLLGSTYVLIKAESFKGVITPVEDRLKTLAREIFLNNDPIHAGAGFILGPILIRGSQDHEQATIKFYDPQRLDVTLEINSSAVTPDEQRHLLQRSDESITLFKQGGANLHTLHRGYRAFAGMQGEEVRASADSKTEQGQALHELLFSAETYRPDPGLLKPTLMVQLETGGHEYWASDEKHKASQLASDYLMRPKSLPSFIVTYDDPSKAPPPPTLVTSSLTDHEATAVWDAILPTIRPRPGAVEPIQPKDNPFAQMPREDAERARQILDAFIASRPGDGSGF